MEEAVGLSQDRLQNGRMNESQINTGVPRCFNSIYCYLFRV